MAKPHFISRVTKWQTDRHSSSSSKRLKTPTLFAGHRLFSTEARMTSQQQQQQNTANNKKSTMSKNQSDSVYHTNGTHRLSIIFIIM